ncbi:hypothetical protein ES703_34565 [subsurface metagenome]
MNENFEKALKVILDTKFEVSPRFLRLGNYNKNGILDVDFEQDGDVEYSSCSQIIYDDPGLLTYGQKEKFYYYFWKKLRCDNIECDMLRLHIFDMGVDCGISRAVKIVQKLLAIKPDGIIDEATLYHMNSQKEFIYWNRWGINEFPMYLWQKYVMERLSHYNHLVYAVNTDLLVFLNDWINRVKKTNYL